MLDPNSRALLLESLRPPEGGALDLAVGTTFTLDLMALLTAPLAFTWFSWEDEEGRPSADPNSPKRLMGRLLQTLSICGLNFSISSMKQYSFSNFTSIK